MLPRSQPAWLLPRCAWPDEHLARKTWLRLAGGRLAALLPRSQPAWLLPRRAWPDEHLARKTWLRLAGVRLAALLPRSQTTSLLPRRALPGEHLARKTGGLRCGAGLQAIARLKPCATGDPGHGAGTAPTCPSGRRRFLRLLGALGGAGWGGGTRPRPAGSSGPETASETPNRRSCTQTTHR